MSRTTTALLQAKLPLQKLEASRGGYFYLAIDAAHVALFPNGKSTRLLCVLDEKLTLHCGLNHLGDGHYFIIVAGRHVQALKKKTGDGVLLSINEDPNPLGVPVPEVLDALLEQDEDLKSIYDGLTDGKKRSLIFLIKDGKDVDRQVQKAVAFLRDAKAGKPLQRRSVRAKRT